MQERPVVVRTSSGIGPAAVTGIVLLVAIVALFIWQPWNTSSTNTTIINQQPGTSAGQNGSGANAGGGTSGSAGSSQGSSGTTGGSSSGSSGTRP